MSARTPRTARPGGLPLRWAAIAAVAVTVLLILRTHVAQRYKIPSRSMEPTLHGDEVRGDLVLVDKAGWLRPHATSALRRFDIVVLRDHENPTGDPLVKRVVSTGDELLRIGDGDIFVRSLRGEPWQRVQKDPIRDRDLRFTYFEYRAGTAAPEPPAHYFEPPPGDDGVIALHAAALTLQACLAQVTATSGMNDHVLATRTIDASFIDADGRRSSAGSRGNNDIGVELDLDLSAACCGVAFAILQHDRVLALTCDRNGEVRWHDPAGTAHATRALGAHVALAFGVLDGRSFLEVDGTLAAIAPWPLPSDADSEHNAIRFAVAGTGGASCARVTRVRLFHDVFYAAENLPGVGIKEYRVEPGEVFLLGDNTFESTDSRRHGPYPAADVVGRPIAVIGPWRRLRWIPR